MNIIDNKVVKMIFDNVDFNTAVDASKLALQELNYAIGKMGSGANFEAIGDSVNTISKRFTLMGIVGTTAIQNIANKAVNAGETIVKSLTIDPVSTGFSEYEQKINSIQTLIKSAKDDKGLPVTLDLVKEKLEDLNVYADRTIYNFQDMTKNITKFTNAGVGYETAVDAIKGISNVAALSGASAENASHAMYNFAQALSTGYIQLIDWKSIKVANMDTAEFKEQLLKTALAMGTVVKEGKKYKTLTTDNTGKVSGAMKMQEMFNGGLKYQWLTTDVLVKTLNDYSDETTEIGKKAYEAATEIKTFTQVLDVLKESAQSGWAISWEYIIGDYKQALKLWGGVNDEIGGIISSIDDKRNEILKKWNELGGRDVAIEGIANTWNTLKNIVSPVKDAFSDIFPPMTGDKLFKITEAFENFTSKTKAFTSNMSFKDAKTALMDITGVAEKTESVYGNLKDTFAGLFAIVDIAKNALGAFWDAFSPLTKYAVDLLKFFLSTTGAIGRWAVSLDNSLKASDKFNKFFSNLTKNGTDFMETAKGIATSIIDIGSTAGESLKNSPLIPIFKKLYELGMDLGGKALGKLKDFGELISETLSNADFSKLAEMLFTFGAAHFTFNILNIVDSFSKLVNSVKGIWSKNGNLGGLLGTLKSSLVQLCQSVKTTQLIKIAVALGVITLSMMALSDLNSDQLGAAIAGITSALFSLTFAFFAINNIVKNSKDIDMAKGVLQTLAISVLILAISMKKLGDMEWDQIVKDIVGVGASMFLLASTAQMLESFDKSRITKGMSGLLIMAVAIRIMAVAVKNMGELDIESLGKGIGAVALLTLFMGLLVNWTEKSRDTGNFVRMGVSMLLIANSMVVFANAVGTFTSMVESNEEALFTGIGALGLVLTAVGLFQKFVGGSEGLIALGVSMVLISKSMATFCESIGKFGEMGPEQLAIGLIALGAALTLIGFSMADFDSNIKGAVSLLIFTAALTGVLNLIKEFGNIPIETIAQGMLVLAVGITGLCIGLNAMNGTLAGAAALLVVSASFLVFAGAMAVMQTINWENVASGLIVAALAIAAFAVSATALSAVAIPIIIASAAIGVMSLALFLLSGALMSFKTVFPGFGKFISEIGSYIIDTLKGISDLISGGGLIDGLSKLGETIKNFFSSDDGTSEEVKKTGEEIPEKMAEGVDEKSEEVENSINKMLNPEGGIGNLIDTEQYKSLGLSIPESIGSGVTEGSDGISSSIEQMMNQANIGSEFDLSQFEGLGVQIPESISSGVESNSDKVTDKTTKTAKEAKEAVYAYKDDFYNTGGYWMDGLAKGESDNAYKVTNAARAAAKYALEAAKAESLTNSPSKKFAELGRWFMIGLGNGITDNSGYAYNSSRNVVSVLLNTMSDSLSTLSSLMNDGFESPTITPVLDLNNVKSGVAAIDEIFGTNRFNLDASLNATAGRIRNIQNGANSSPIIRAIENLGNKLDNVGNTTVVNGVTYDNGSSINNAVETIVHAALIEGRA